LAHKLSNDLLPHAAVSKTNPKKRARVMPKRYSKQPASGSFLFERTDLDHWQVVTPNPQGGVYM